MTTLAETRSRLAEIDERLPQCRSELLTLAESDLGEDETARFDGLRGEFDSLTAEREPLAARLAAMTNVVDTARAAQAAAEADEDDNVSNRSGGLESGGRSTPTRSRTTRLDPFADLDTVRSGRLAPSDVRARALNAVEQNTEHVFDDDQREKVTGLLERSDRHGRIAQHVLMVGSSAYTRAFSKLLEGTQPYSLAPEELEALNQADAYQRASMAEGSQATGGYLVPFFVDPTVMLQNAGSTNPLRQISRVETITGPTWRGITTAGVTASWLGEAAAATEASLSFAQPTVDVFKGSAYLRASFEVTQDTNVASEIGPVLADAKDQLEAAAFITGTGSGQPKGIVTALAAVGGSIVAPTDAGVFGAKDVYKLAGAIPPRYRGNTSWLANQSIYLLARQFATGSGPQSAFWADFGMNTPAELIGRPIHESSVMDGTLATATHNYALILGDFKNFLIADRIGMTVQFQPMVLDTTTNNPNGQVGWFAHWRVGSGCLNPDAFRMLDIPV